MTKKILRKEDVKHIQVTRDDGSVWSATINEKGQVELVSEVSPPTSPSSPSKPSTPEEPSGEPEQPPLITPETEGPGSIEDVLAGLAKVDGFGGKGPSDKLLEREDQPKTVPSLPEKVKEMVRDSAFKSQLSSVMLDNKYDRMLRGRTRGKLDMTRLYKVPTQARSVFKQKQARRGKMYNVLLLVDESGSMMDDGKSERAAESVVFLAKAFEGININVAIVGFNRIITTRKEFTGPADYDRIYEAIRTMNFRHGHGDNNDWDALNKAYQMFDKAPEGENILVMLSDGYPASVYRPNFVDIHGKDEKEPKGTGTLDPDDRDEKVHLHHLVKANAHRVKSIGIGIKEGGWQIPDYEVVKDVNELKPAIIKQLRKHITRG